MKHLIANWKMHPTTQKEAERLAREINAGYKDLKNKGGVRVAICPPFLYLENVREQLSSGINIGGQNVYFENRGAFTGEVSPLMLKDAKCSYVIIGHSERRGYFDETGEMINKKIKASLDAGLTPILAVGETKEEKEEAGRIINEQLTSALEGVSRPKINKLLIAYEPVWAIGTGEAASVNDAMTMRLHIQKVLSELYDKATANKIPVLYGGSTDSKNIKDFIEEGNMDGALVGGSSLKPNEFIKMIEKSVSL